MNPRARFPLGGALCLCRGRGYTLIEMCVVILIIMLFITAGVPAIETAFTEQAVRADSRELELMVRTAMVQSSDQHRPYVIDLTASNLYLHPAEALVADSDEPAPATNFTSADEPATNAPSEDVEVFHALDPSNRLLLPDPDKPEGWVPVTPVEWRFDPSGLCLLPKVRVERGKSWLEMSFSPLTGNVDDESYFFP